MKNIFHITENISYDSGGMRTILMLLHQYLLENNYNSHFITNNKEENDNCIALNSKKIWLYNPELKKVLTSIKDKHLLHLHGVYTYYQYAAYKNAMKNNVPYIVSPHGMLEPWILEKNPIKKQLYLKLVLNKILFQAKALHSITPLETESLYKLTKHKNIVEIPNLIHFQSIPIDFNPSFEEDYFIYIGRIDKKKGLELLIESISNLKNKTVKLKIIGKENNYALFLKDLVKKNNLEKRIEFLGGVFGREKYQLISNARALVAPSFSEAIGMVNLEGAACKTPVITTFQTGLKKEWGENGGILINPTSDALLDALNKSVAWSSNERNDMGKTLNSFVYENYSWEKKGILWNELYDSIS